MALFQCINQIFQRLLTGHDIQPPISEFGIRSSIIITCVYISDWDIKTWRRESEAALTLGKNIFFIVGRS